MDTQVAVPTVAAPPGPPLGSIFLAFLKLGSFAFGGVYGMLSFLEKELVDRRRWISADELAEGVALGQMTPGPPIVNVGVFVGYRLRGLPGALAATAGQILPGFVIVLVVGALYAELRSAPLLQGALKGVAAAVVGLLGSVVVRLARRVVDGPGTAIVAVACFALLAFAHANPIALLACAALAGWAFLGGRA